MAGSGEGSLMLESEPVIADMAGDFGGRGDGSGCCGGEGNAGEASLTGRGDGGA